MRRYFTYDPAAPADFIKMLLFFFALSMIGFGLFFDTPIGIINGIYTILITPCGLITDYIAIAGIGASFVHAGILTLLCMLVVMKAKITYSGATVGALFYIAGFALFGKNIGNIWPIIFGVYLYSIYQKEPFSRYIYTALFGCCLAPVVTEIAATTNLSLYISLPLSIMVGVLVGFIFSPLATHSLAVHQGYNLYNVGFAAGLIGTILVSVSKSFGKEYEPRMHWSSGNNLVLSIYLFALFIIIFFIGFFINGRSLKGLYRITRHSGRAVADFILMDGLPVSLMNMGILGVMSTVYILLTGGQINGPTIGGIFGVMGFGGFGKHYKNCFILLAGALIGGLLNIYDVHAPAVQLASLFATGLAPIAGQFGIFWGLLAGFLHSSVVLCSSTLHGGLNLYNNGFSAGLVATVLVPVIESIKRNHTPSPKRLKEKLLQRKNAAAKNKL